MRKYFVYELKKNIFAIAVLTLVSTCVYSVFIPWEYIRGISETNIGIISMIGILLAVFVPVWLMEYKMKKRSLDLFYSLPLTHGKILFTKFLIGIIAIFVPYTLSYWVGSTIMMARFPQDIFGVWFIPLYFASLIPIYFIYAICCFAFTRANKKIDGIVFIVFWLFAVALFVELLNMRTNHVLGTDENGRTIFGRYWFEPRRYLPFAPIDYLTLHFEGHIAGRTDMHTVPIETVELVNVIVGFGLTALMAIGSTAGLFLAESKFVKAEDAGQISDSWFGYKVMIPFYTFCLAALAGDAGLSYIIFIAIGTYVISILYKRTAKIGWKWTIVILVCFIAGVAASFVKF